jgi:hypothetical protein
MHPLPVAGLVALELAGALTLRAIAARRWTGIDWLALRDSRARSQVPKAPVDSVNNERTRRGDLINAASKR